MRTKELAALPPVLSAEDFVRHIARELGVSPPSAGLEAHLVHDLNLDSLGMMGLALVLLDLGIVLPNAALMQLVDLGDVYHYYSTQATSNDPGGFLRAEKGDAALAQRESPLVGHLVRLRAFNQDDYRYF